MRVVIADIGLLQEAIRGLHGLLPEAVRSSGPSSPGGDVEATQVLKDVARYIAKLKNEALDLRDRASSISALAKKRPQPSPPPFSSSPSGPTRFIANESDLVQNICLPPGSRLADVKGVGKAIFLPDRQRKKSALATSSTQSSSSSSSSSSPSPTIVQLAPGAKIPIATPPPAPSFRAPHPPPPGRIAPGPDLSHGLACPRDCRCRLSDDRLPLLEDYRRQAVSSLRRATAVDRRVEADAFLAEIGAQEEVLRALVDRVPRRQLHKLLRLVSNVHDDDSRSKYNYVVLYSTCRGGRIYFLSWLLNRCRNCHIIWVQLAPVAQLLEVMQSPRPS